MSGEAARGRERAGWLSRRLREVALKGGAGLVGFGEVRDGLAPELERLPRAVSLGVVLPRSETGRKRGDVATFRVAELEERLRDIQRELCRELRAEGWRFLAIPPDTLRPDGRFVSRLFPLFPHKTAATCSGLGWVGKSGLLVAPGAGPRAVWASVLTDAPLDTCRTPVLQGRCGPCRLCVDACPAGAIRDVEWRRGEPPGGRPDPVACARQMERNLKVLGKAECLVCATVCPGGEVGATMVGERRSGREGSV